MLTYKMTTANRKDLVKRLSELTEIPAKYMGVPSCGYQVGRYRIAKDGTLTVDDIAADTEMLAQLINEGLIAGEIPVGEEAPVQGGGSAQEASVEKEALTGNGGTVEEKIPAEEEPQDSVTAGDTAGNETVTENAAERTSDDPAGCPTENSDTVSLRVSVPMTKHTGVSLRNLMNLIYSRGRLLRKATGAGFEVEAGLIEVLEDDSCTVTREKLMRAIADYETEHGKSISGIEMSPDEITFIFGSADAEHADAFTKLAGLMNRQALTQKRIRAKEVDDTNEKYALRTWLLRIGMTGPDYKEARRELMENLGGHTAFRTPEEAERAKQKNLEKRLALKAAKAAAESGGGETAMAESAEAETTALDTPSAQDGAGTEGTPQD